MKPSKLAALALVPLLAGCGPQVQVWNPTTWFSQDQPERLITLGQEAPDVRPYITTVTSAVVERVNGGIIVRAEGMPPTQGYWSAELVQRSIENGVMTLDFRIAPPPTGTGEVGTPASRKITVAFTISEKGLRDKEVTRIVVKAQNNSITLRP